MMEFDVDPKDLCPCMVPWITLHNFIIFPNANRRAQSLRQKRMIRQLDEFKLQYEKEKGPKFWDSHNTKCPIVNRVMYLKALRTPKQKPKFEGVIGANMVPLIKVPPSSTQKQKSAKKKLHTMQNTTGVVRAAFTLFLKKRTPGQKITLKEFKEAYNLPFDEKVIDADLNKILGDDCFAEYFPPSAYFPPTKRVKERKTESVRPTKKRKLEDTHTQNSTVNKTSKKGTGNETDCAEREPSSVVPSVCVLEKKCAEVVLSLSSEEKTCTRSSPEREPSESFLPLSSLISEEGISSPLTPDDEVSPKGISHTAPLTPDDEVSPEGISHTSLLTPDDKVFPEGPSSPLTPDEIVSPEEISSPLTPEEIVSPDKLEPPHDEPPENFILAEDPQRERGVEMVHLDDRVEEFPPIDLVRIEPFQLKKDVTREESFILVEKEAVTPNEGVKMVDLEEEEDFLAPPIKLVDTQPESVCVCFESFPLKKNFTHSESDLKSPEEEANSMCFSENDDEMMVLDKRMEMESINMEVSVLPPTPEHTSDLTPSESEEEPMMVEIGHLNDSGIVGPERENIGGHFPFEYLGSADDIIHSSLTETVSETYTQKSFDLFGNTYIPNSNFSESSQISKPAIPKRIIMNPQTDIYHMMGKTVASELCQPDMQPNQNVIQIDWENYFN